MLKVDKPYTSWPTVAVCIFSIVLCLLTVYVRTVNIPFSTTIETIFYKIFMTIAAIFFCSFVSYSQFTVTHESVHGNISKNKYVNNIIGFISSFSLGPTGNWFGFKEHHMAHHLKTNDPLLDPDMWCSGQGYGGEKYIALRWATLDLYYVYIFVKQIGNYKLGIMVYTILNYLLGMQLLISLINTFGIFNVLQFWIIPSRISIMLLAFAFDYLPHYPHDITKDDDRYKTTSYIACPWIIKLVLSPISFYQDHHIIHHENPTIPFYMYREAWDKHKDDFIKKGARINNIIPATLSPILGKNV